MKWIGQHIYDLVTRFRSDVYFTSLTETNETNGLVIDANGKLSYRVDVDEDATHIYENVRNDEGVTIPIGTPVYSKGEVGGSERILVGIAKANDPTKMPAIGITNTELTTTDITKDGLMTLVGVYNTNLSGFTGLSTNQIVYVAPTGGLTITKPNGGANGNLIQNIGIILKTNGTIIQGLQVTCIGRTNDVPNPLAIDHANQLVGVGTASPTEKLHVVGKGIFTDQVTIPATPVASTDAASKSYVDAQVGASDTLQEVTDNGNTTTNSIMIGSSSSPSASLHVVGQYIQLERSGTMGIQFGNSSNLNAGRILYSSSSLNNFMSFYTNDSEKMRLTSGGNLLIGTTTDSGSKLKVQYAGGSPSGIIVQSTSNRSKIAVADNNTAAYVIAEDSFASYGMQDNLSANNLNINNLGNVLIGTTTDSGAKLDVSGVDNGVFFRRNTGQYFKFTTDAHSNRIESAGKTVFLGTTDAKTLYLKTNDTARITIDSAGATTLTGSLTGTSANFSGNVGVIGTGNLTIRNTSGSGSGIIFLDTTWQGGIEHSSGNLFFRTGGQTDKMVLRHNGNLLLGTTTDNGYKLDVSGLSIFKRGTGTTPSETTANSTIAVFQHNENITDYSTIAIISGTNGASELKFGDSNDENAGFIGYNNLYDTMSFRTNGSGEDMRITSGGNLLIGTTTDSGEKLVVNGNAKFADQVTIPATPVASTDAASKGYVDAQVSATDSLQEVTTVGNTTTNSIMIGSSSSPSEKLEVDGIVKVVHTDSSYVKYRGQGVFFNRATSYLAPEVDNFASINVGYNGARWGNVLINGAFVKFSNGATENMRLTSAGDLGIGTTSPSEKLELEGTGELSVKINNSQYSRSLTISQGGGYSHLKTSHVSGIAINYAESNVGILSLFNNTTQAVKINANGNSYFNGGNLGINESNPASKLEITGGNIQLADGWGLRWDDAANTQLLASASDGFKFSTGGSEKMRLTSDGKLLINATSSNPLSSTSILQVAGKAVFEGVDVFKGDATANPRLRIGRNELETLNFDVDDGTARIYHKQDELSSTNHAINITLDSETTADRNINFGFRDIDGSNESTKMRLTSGGNLLIGTTSASNPNAKLQVVNTNAGGDVDGLLLENLTDVTNSSVTLTMKASGNNTRNVYLKAINTSGSGEPQDLAFGTNAAYTATSEKMRLTSDGKLGIGTTSPQELLHINGQARFQNATSGNQGAFGIDSAGAYFGSYSNIPVRFIIQNGVKTPLYINTSGNVGIGTSSPLHKLEVRGGDTHFENTSSTNTFLDVKGTSANAYIRAYSDSNSVWLYQGGSSSYLSAQSGSTLRLNSGSSNLIFLDSSGEVMRSNNANLLIGTTTDNGEKLQVEGDITASGDIHSDKLVFSGTNNRIDASTAGTVKIITSGVETATFTGTSSYLRNPNIVNTILLSGTKIVDTDRSLVNINNITTSGNVSLGGTVGAVYKLDVVGKARVQSVLELDDVLTLNQISTPSDPEAGQSSIYMDSADGAIKCKINVGGTVVTRTLASFEE
jgi:hypothetical protein